MASDDLEFDDRDFNRARELIRRFAGISLADSKKALVHGRLAGRVRTLGLTMSAFLQRVEDDEGEREQFINALTTNVTDFFREKHHFEALRGDILPRLLKTRANRKLRFWSAGCSSGEEPYTIAMTLRTVDIPSGWDAKVLATDLDSNIIARASAGIYPLARVEPVPDVERKRFFQTGRGGQEGHARVSEEIRSLITFRQLNLMGDWPFKGPMDVIFCRNVMIYFDDPTRRRLVDRFVQMLAPDGVLILGHSESLMGVHPQLSSAGRTIFNKQTHARQQAA